MLRKEAKREPKKREPRVSTPSYLPSWEISELCIYRGDGGVTDKGKASQQTTVHAAAYSAQAAQPEMLLPAEATLLRGKQDTLVSALSRRYNRKQKQNSHTDHGNRN